MNIAQATMTIFQNLMMTLSETLNKFHIRIAPLLLAMSLPIMADTSTEALPEPAELRCDGKENNIAAIKKPRLTWEIHSAKRGVNTSHWQVLVASKPDLLAEGKADLWDSGKTVADRTPGAIYDGKPLKSGMICHWKARYWVDDTASAWSETATFEVAPSTPEEWQGAVWINDGKKNPENDADFYKPDPAPLMRREFEVDKPVVRARLHVAGLGLSIPSINGERVDEHVFDPPWTRFDKRILYRTHDLTDQIKEGTNCLGLTLGNGWYNPLPLRMWGRRNLREALPVGRPRGIAYLVMDHPDGTSTTITTDSKWQTTDGPTIFNSIYLGVIHDARLEIEGWDRAGFDASGWKKVQVTDDKLELLQPLRMPPVRLQEAIPAKKITEPENGTYIVDFGVNGTGIPKVKIDAPAGTEITFRYGELIHEDGTLNPMTSVCGQIKGTKKLDDGTEQSVGGPGAPAIAWQQNVFIASGNGPEVFQPDFTFHGFRYMEVKGLTKKPKLEDYTLYPLYTDLATAGKFECSNEKLNKIQEVILRTFLTNAVTVQSDCPHRERFGYGGDIVATSGAYLMNFDMSGFYAKTVRDWADSVLPDGRLTDTAPFVGVDYCGVGWAMVHPLLVEQLYQYHGNKRIVEEQLPVADKWLTVVAGQREGGLVMSGLGDHEALANKREKGPQLSTPMFVYTCKRLARLARIIDQEDDAKRFETWAQESQKAWSDKFLNEDTGIVENGSQTDQCFALGFDSAPEGTEDKIFDQLVEELMSHENAPQLTTGIYGTWILMEELSRRGRSDLAYALATRETFPSWHWMIKNGATTLWENWEGSDGTFSQNHPMFGSVSEWYYRWLGGIQCAPDAVAFDRITIEPYTPDDLDWVNTYHHSPRGKIVSNWKRDGESMTFDIVIPADTTAKVILPAESVNSVSEGGKPLSAEMKAQAKDDQVQLSIGSGSYQFTIK